LGLNHCLQTGVAEARNLQNLIYEFSQTRLLVKYDYFGGHAAKNVRESLDETRFLRLLVWRFNQVAKNSCFCLLIKITANLPAVVMVRLVGNFYHFARINIKRKYLG